MVAVAAGGRPVSAGGNSQTAAGAAATQATSVPGDTASLSSGDTQPPPDLANPLAWGWVGAALYPGGSREAPNGRAFNPLSSLDLDFNLQLLPHKELYLFTNDSLWIRRSGLGASGLDRREADADLGLAWSFLQPFELRASAFSLTNLNRGNSLARPSGFVDGSRLSGRYYLDPGDPYDVGRLSYLTLGGYPTRAMLTGDSGPIFRAGLFAGAYLTHDLPTPFLSYVYGGLRLNAQDAVTPRLLDSDVGLAVRPFDDWQKLELRLGYSRSDDVVSQKSRNLVYGAVRLAFGADTARPGIDAGGGLGPPSMNWRPEFWGVVGLPIYWAGTRMAPNGVAFTPIFDLSGDLNLGLLPDKELYLFGDGSFWGQHAAPGITNAGQGGFDFSKRELDTELGLAWNHYGPLEFRPSLYALDNISRGLTPNGASGGKDGVKLEERYILPFADPYDVARLNFLSIGYIPAGTLIGENGAAFHPGAFARAHLTRDLQFLPWTSYLFGDVQVTTASVATPRLVDADIGWAVRPFRNLPNLEFRLGSRLGDDLRANLLRGQAYVAVRVLFDGPR
jgi:hypothetical protein